VQREDNIEININGVLCTERELNQSSADWAPFWAQNHEWTCHLRKRCWIYGAAERLLWFAMTTEVMVGCVRKEDIRLFMSSPTALYEVWSYNLNTITNLVAICRSW